MPLIDQLATHVGAILNTDHFGESVTYTPKGGAPLTRTVLVRRTPPDGREESSNYRVHAVRVWIRNDATNGVVTPNEGDTILMVMRPGDPASTARVTAILTSTRVLHQLEVSGGG